MTPSETLNLRPIIPATPMRDCVVCGASQWDVVGCGQDFEYETCSNQWAYHACARCGHVQIAELPAPETLATIYPSNYYSYAMDSVNPIARWAKAMLDDRKFAKILSACKSPLTSYLDVGCGDGRYLQHLIDKGTPEQNVYGVELDNRAVSRAVERGLQVQQCRIEDATHLRKNYFDLITMFHVVEHVSEPDKVVARLAELLTADGVLAIETPNFDSLDARLARERFWGGYHIPRHWHVFTPESLIELLKRAGLSVVALRFQPGHAFWIWTLHHWLKYGRNSPQLAKLCHPLRNVALLSLVTVFDILRARLGQRTSAMLILARRKSV